MKVTERSGSRGSPTHRCSPAPFPSVMLLMRCERAPEQWEPMRSPREKLRSGASTLSIPERKGQGDRATLNPRGPHSFGFPSMNVSVPVDLFDPHNQLLTVATSPSKLLLHCSTFSQTNFRTFSSPQHERYRCRLSNISQASGAGPPSEQCPLN